MKKLLLMIPLLSVIGLMSSCGGKDPDYVTVYYKVSHLIRDTIIEVDPNPTDGSTIYHEGDDYIVRPNTIYAERMVEPFLSLKIHYKYEFKQYKPPYETYALTKIGGDPVDVQVTFYFYQDKGYGKLPDGTESFISNHWDASEKPNAEGKIVVTSKIWVKLKSEN